MLIQNSLCDGAECRIYILTGLNKGKAGDGWPSSSDLEIITAILKLAKELDLRLNLNQIPSEFKQLSYAMPITLLAIKKNDPELLIILVEHGASLTNIESFL
jgi:hypothetical protein